MIRSLKQNVIRNHLVGKKKGSKITVPKLGAKVPQGASVNSQKI